MIPTFINSCASPRKRGFFPRRIPRIINSMTQTPTQSKIDARSLGAETPSRPTRRQFIVRNLALLATVAYADGISEADQIEVTRHQVPMPRLRAPMRVVQITDLHRSWCVSEDFISRVVTQSIALRPDLILLTGDFVTRTSDYAPSC